jgi:hypothetical protein
MRAHRMPFKAIAAEFRHDREGNRKDRLRGAVVPRDSLTGGRPSTLSTGLRILQVLRVLRVQLGHSFVHKSKVGGNFILFPHIVNHR